MTTYLASGLLAAAVAAAASAGPIPKYRVTVTIAQHRDFSKLRTYSWMPSHPAALPGLDAQIVAAVDRELAALGMTKAAGSDGDAVVTYLSTTRTDVKVNAEPIAKDLWPEYQVGTLVVSLLDPRSLKPMLQLRADRIIGTAPIESTASRMIADMFKQYPTRRRH